MITPDLRPGGNPGGTVAKLAALEHGRRHALDRIITTARGAHVDALLLIGSLGRGGGDSWSDLDLIAVPGKGYRGLDLVDLFGSQVLASVRAPRNAPSGGDYLGVCLDVSGLPLWIDWYLWPHATVLVPADGTAIYDDFGLSESELTFIPLIQSHSDPAAEPHTDAAVASLLRVAVAAKYLARWDLAKLAAKLPGAQGLSVGQAADALRERLDALARPDLAGAREATRKLVDLAEAVAGESDQTAQQC